jgi:hypothetical protein
MSDPLRDEGISFYRLLMHSGVRARCRQVMGTIHGTEIFPTCCPDISTIPLVTLPTSVHAESIAWRDWA